MIGRPSSSYFQDVVPLPSVRVESSPNFVYVDVTVPKFGLVTLSRNPAES